MLMDGRTTGFGQTTFLVSLDSQHEEANHSLRRIMRVQVDEGDHSVDRQNT
jgi:hypothetical protein